VERFEQILEKIKERGHRMTPQRLAILRILANSKDHPSAEMIYNQIKKEYPVTSFATVYKTIALVKELREVLELEFSHDSNRYDGKKPYPHPHLICVECKKITDPLLDSVEHLQHEITSQTGFKVVNHRLDFFGICPECQSLK
jgi:Fur family transcriptional regulator, peroxide stress response regulator